MIYRAISSETASMEKPSRPRKPGVSATARTHFRSFGNSGRIGESGRSDFQSRFSEQMKWEHATKPKFFTPSKEPPIGRLLLHLKPDDFLDKSSDLRPQSVVTECRAVVSYNWLDEAEPTIVVPGKPPRWTPMHEPRRLRPDNGEYFRDLNAAQYPEHPLEPAVVATLTSQADIARHIDIVACNKTFEYLLSFMRSADKTFRMLVELIDGTVFFVRRENTATERLSNVRGYGHSFPEAYTTWDAEVKASITHKRVIAYQFGDLRFLVRTQGDGYLPEEFAQHKEIREAPAPADLDLKEEVDTLSNALAASRVTSNMPVKGRAQLQVVYAGDLVRQDRIFDLKTRSVRRKEEVAFEDTFGNHLPNLWATQISNFILAYHEHGLFKEISVRNVESDVKKWERDNVELLSRFAALIHHIVELIKSRPDAKLELRHIVPGELEVREQLGDAGDALSKPVREMWGRAKSQGISESLAALGGDDDTLEVESDDWDDGGDLDYTACSAADCGYCGRCSY